MSETPVFDAEKMTRLRRVGEVAVSPDGTWLAVTVDRLDEKDARYVSDLWRVPLDGSGDAVQLTRGDCKDRAPRFRRDGALGFLSNRNPRAAEPQEGDDKRFQVWILPAGGGEPVPLTDEPLGANDFRFARDADCLAVIASVLPGVAHDEQRQRATELAKHGPSGLHYKTMPIRHWDYWRPVAAPHVIAYDERGQQRRDLTPTADPELRESIESISWDLSRDGRRVAIVANRPGPERIEDLAIRLIDTATGEHRDLGCDDRTMHGSPRFSPDGRTLACTRWLREAGKPGPILVWAFDVDSGQGRAVAPDWDVWPRVADWTDDGAAIIAVADYRGDVPVFRVDARSGEVERITAAAAGGSHQSVVVCGQRIAGVRHRWCQPPEPFTCDLVAGAEPTLLAALSGMDASEAEAFATWESITVTGDGGTAIQSFVATPRGAGPHPALLWIHGGPMGQHGDGWHWRWNPLVCVAAGYVVALPNPRGSTGFGQEMIDGIWHNQWGGACYRDLLAVTDAVAARPDVDAARMGAMGGSFGGYMANWIGANTDRFKCLMSHAGIYHFTAFHGATDYPSFFCWELGQTPYQRSDDFERFSPHRGVANWKTPVLIIHGEKDYRVPVSEALLLFEALQEHGVESELLVYPDENHWILKPRNSRDWYRRVLEFADRYLR